MKKLELVSSKKLKLPKDDEYLWRYFDLHKFLNLVHNKTFRFTRMDQFEDPLEGIPLSALLTYRSKVNLNLIQNISLSELILDANITQDIPEPLMKKLKAINGIQKSTFVTCWFYEQQESMAMWNLYSNADGIALKIPFGKLKENLKVDHGSVSAYYGGLVDYQNVRGIGAYETGPVKKLQKVALRKDSSFSHEKEFRFVARTNNHKLEHLGIDSQPLDLKKLEMKVVCHPRMAGWKKNNVRSLLESGGLGSGLIPSEIQLRQ